MYEVIKLKSSDSQNRTTCVVFLTCWPFVIYLRTLCTYNTLLTVLYCHMCIFNYWRK